MIMVNRIARIDERSCVRCGLPFAPPVVAGEAEIRQCVALLSGDGQAIAFPIGVLL